MQVPRLTAERLVDLVSHFPTTVETAADGMSAVTALGEEVDRLARPDGFTLTEGERAFLVQLKIAVSRLKADADNKQATQWADHCTRILAALAIALAKPTVGTESLGGTASVSIETEAKRDWMSQQLERFQAWFKANW